MKHHFTQFAWAFLALVLCTSLGHAQLSGNYTIGGSSASYSTVSAAVSALTTNGVSGPVTFSIADGTYSGQLSLGSGITGASSTNTILFKGASGDSSKVIITNSGSYTIYSSGTDYVTFQDVTISTTGSSYNIYLSSGSNYNRFVNCYLIGGTASSYASYNVYVYGSEYNELLNCRIQNGYYGVYLYGNGTGSSAAKGNKIIGSTITQHYYYGVESYYQRELVFNNNYIDSCSNNGYGFMDYYGDKFEVMNNEIYGCYYGLYLYYHNQYGSSTDSSKFINNIVTNNMYYGLYSYYIPKCHFYHNVFDGGSGNYSAVFQYCGASKVENNIFTGDGLYYGFYCYYSSSSDAPTTWDYNDYWFNNPDYFGVFENYAYTTFAALKSAYSNYNQNCVTVDPGFTSRKDGRTYAPGLNNIGHNKYIKNDIDGNPRPNKNDAPKVDIGPNDFYLAPYDLDVYALVSPLSVSLTKNTITAQFRNSGSKDITKTDVYVQYSVDSGKTWVTDTMSISSLSPGNVMDFDFSAIWKPTRSGHFGISIRISQSVSGDPDLVDRKDYYVCSGLAGTFTISARTKADFASFNDALKALNCGVAGPIVFNVLGGTYTERLQINVLQGASATNTVTFRSPHIDSVTLQYNASSNVQQNTVQFNGGDYVSFENMRIEADNSNYGGAVHFMNQSNYNRFEGCVLQCNTSGVSTYSNPVVFSSSESSYYGNGDNGNYNQFIDNTIIGGYFGVVVNGQSTSLMSEGNQFIGNDIRSAYYYGTYFYYVSDLVFNDNTIDNFRYQYNYALYMVYVSNYELQRNYFKAYYGNIFEMGNYYNYKNKRSLIANNVFAGENQDYAFDGYYMSYTDFWHNSLYGKGYYLCYFYYIQQADIRNNIFYYDGSQYAVYSYYPSFVAWDYNDYYLGSGNVAYLDGTTYPTVGSLKSYNATLNQNNFEENPQWVDPTSNHHVTSKFPEMYGQKVGILDDFDGDTRCKFAPSVGSDEFVQSQLPPVASFLAPDTAWLGAPALILNANKPSKTTGAIWYVNGKFASDSIHLEYTPANAGWDTIALVMENCSGTDSTSKLVWVSPITRAPKIDFGASSLDIYTGDLLTLFDLSANGITQWEWNIDPKFIYVTGFGYRARTYYYVRNDSTSSTAQVVFEYPGIYSVKFKVANSLGVDSLERVAYIKVRQKSNMCDIPWDTDGSYGTLYDNGGEFGSYSPNLNGLNKCTYSISSCKGEVELDFTQFELAAGDYLQVYDGTDASARPMWDAATYPDGMNGNKQDKSVMLNMTAKSGSAYFVFTSDNNAQTTGKGFAVNWEILSTTWTSPAATISKPDTACTGFPTLFENASTGNWSYVEWDLNNDGTVDGYGEDFTYTFGSPGTYSIKLTAFSLCAPRDSVVSSIVIEGARKAPTPDFSVSATKVAAGDTVEMRGSTDYCASSYEWLITPNTYLLVKNTKTSEEDIDVVFLRGGYYTVQFAAGNTFGKDSIIRTNYIQVVDYCTPSVVNLDPDMGISRVAIGDIDNSTQQGAVGYNNYLHLSTDVERGQSYDITVERNSGGTKPMNRKVWVDWNIDGDFDDAGELVASEASGTSATFTASIKVPGDAVAGSTRLRVSANYKDLKNLACGPHQFGEFEDYTLEIGEKDLTAP
ncbi:MAG: right-handed parallel beta-helix repeat-containing protein, partial [Bacteroidetes bacterium]|nr:right-handed parallel beta-helix repeat-containing protein [Bacteroidota bacterium]